MIQQRISAPILTPRLSFPPKPIAASHARHHVQTPDADYPPRPHRSSCAYISAPVTALRKYDRAGNLLQTLNSNTNAGNNWGAEFAVPSDGGCPADLDGDGDTDADDFFAYLDAFASGDLEICDIDGDDDCDADDFFGYLDLFAQGC